MPRLLPATFLVDDEQGLDLAPLRRRLEARGYREVSLARAAIDGVGLAWINMRADDRFAKEAYDIRATLKSLLYEGRRPADPLGKEVVTDKGRLHSALHDSPLVAASQDLAAAVTGPCVLRFPLIVRPVGPAAQGGHGVSVAADAAELAASAAALRKLGYPRALASEYIREPMLVEVASGDRRKFHLRMYLLYATADGVRAPRSSVFARGRILTAAAPYRDSDYGDKAIHDTHGASTPRDLYFPEDFPGDAAAALEQARAVGARLAELLAPVARPYPESRAAFEVFGLDLLPDATGRIWLLEANARVNYRGGPSPAWTQFSDDYFAWVLDTLEI